MSPERAREWWTQRHAAIPLVETTEMHIIGGAILPLWQRLKTQEGTRLRVVRVSTDAGQRIVGVWIPRDRVRAVLGALGIGCNPHSPEEIFQGVLQEAAEVTLAANLKLKPGNIHGEAAIELCCADPHKFAQLRELGLINEQIKWKQRFFIPTDETTGIETLNVLLQLYPAIVSEESAEEECGAQYQCYGQPVEITPEYQYAIFAVLPIGQLEVIEDPDDQTHEEKIERVGKSGLPVSLVQE